MKFVTYPSIGQFRNTVKGIRDCCDYNSWKRPTIEFTGTVKLHGTNAGVNLCNGEITAQSRSRGITLLKDNAGFAAFVDYHKEVFNDLFVQLGASLNDETRTIFGEWCGGSIQKGVALNELEKMFVVFGVSSSKKGLDEDGNEIKITNWITDFKLDYPNDVKIYGIDRIPSYKIEVDFNEPELAQVKLHDLTMAVEKECPFSKSFGISGVGEGIVWTAQWNNVIHRFKTKGDKHSASKVKTIAKVDVEVLNSTRELVNTVATENRFEQGIQETFGDADLDIRKMGDYLKWVNQDIIKEESDTIFAAGLTVKNVSKEISKKAREYFMTKWNTL